MKLFKPEDFYSILQLTFFSEQVAHAANKKLQEWLEQQPVVYGNMYINNENTGIDVGSVWNITKLNDHSRRARLVCIEPIVQEHECEPAMLADLPYLCKICGAELVAKWEKVK